jgi:ABC-type lipoprotein export system ATPase subunit
MSSYRGGLPGELSGGEQQRVANDPPLIVADEPTGDLDSTASSPVFELLESFTITGKTVVYVAHDCELASRAAASIELLDGRIVDRLDGQDPAGAPVMSRRISAQARKSIADILRAQSALLPPRAGDTDTGERPDGSKCR